ncbi:MAG TPA: polysaccharide biosynthesis C-terminal domain-containing protein [Bacteroidota bacterium]|nr:polysaccharide biosynthesis C-terminal domain-containing protein [Bacteroidota bacterium]
MTTIIVVVSIALLYIAFFSHGIADIFTFVAVTCIYITEYLNQYFNNYSKGINKFSLLVKGSLAAEVAGILLLALVFFMSYNGYLLSKVLSSAICTGYYLYALKFRFSFTLKKSAAWEIIRTGLPMQVLVVTWLFFYFSDRLVVLYALDNVSLGLYSIVSIISFPLVTYINSVHSVFLTKSTQIRTLTNSYEQTAELFLKLIHLQRKALGIILLGLVFATPILLTHFLPKFRESIIPAQFFCIGFSFYAMASGLGNLLITFNRTAMYIVITVVSSMLNLALGYLLVRSGYGLPGVAVSTAISYMIYSLCLFISSLKNDKKLSFRLMADIYSYNKPLLFAALIAIASMTLIEVMHLPVTVYYGLLSVVLLVSYPIIKDLLHNISSRIQA